MTPPSVAAPKTGEFAAADGVRLRWHGWPVADARAALLLSHGLGEHAGRYAPVAAWLARHGVAVYAPDHRGHGGSGGVQGHVERFAHFADDFARFRHEVAGRVARLPLFVMGHSLGGLIALRYLQTHPHDGLRGAVLSAPALEAALRPPRWKTAAAGVLSRLAPRLRLGNEIDPSFLSRDEAYVRAYRDDPLVHPWITPRLYTELLAAAAQVWTEAERLRLPLLFVVPGDDPVIRAATTERFARGLRGDVTLRSYPGLRHEPHNERERDTVLGDVAAWIAARSG